MAKESKSIKEDLHGQPILTKYPDDQVYKEGIYDHMNFDKNYNYYHIMGHEEPHLVRRKQILAAHPEIKHLYGTEIATLWVAFTVNLAQFTAAYYFRDLNWFLFIITAYVVGGTITHTCQILVHDVTHFLCFETLSYNKLLAIFSNLPTGIPSAITFGRYHFDHHTYMNIKEHDPDLPSEWEIRIMNTPFKKFLFIFFQSFFYGLRPLILMPKKPTLYEAINLVAVFTVDYIVYVRMGGFALLWIILGALIGIGPHPCAGHTIAEHYEFQHRLETYDYIGIVNFFNINVGYHVEHHDFPMVPWTRLPLIRKMAPEFYENLPYHTSYVKVFMTQSIFITI